MASEKQSALASWITGWSNITGQVTLICSINYSWLVVAPRLFDRVVHDSISTEFIATGIAMATDGAVVLGSGASFGIIVALHITQAIFCSSGTRILARMTVLVLIIIRTSQSCCLCCKLTLASGHDDWCYHIAFGLF